MELIANQLAVKLFSGFDAGTCLDTLASAPLKEEQFWLLFFSVIVTLTNIDDIGKLS